MTLATADRNSIIDYRIEKSLSTLAEAKFTANGKFWSLTANRMYYAVFYVCEALLIKHGYEVSSHAGVMRMLGLNFVKTGILSMEDSYLIKNLFQMRQTGDYNDLFDWKEDDIVPLIPQVETLINKIIDIIKGL